MEERNLAEKEGIGNMGDKARSRCLLLLARRGWGRREESRR